MVLPGFNGDDPQTNPLRQLLLDVGYDTHGWGLGPNRGPSDELDAQLLEIPERFTEPVTLIGVSLGGVYAREIARTRPGLVRDVITLGAPHQAPGGFGPSTTLVPGTPDRERPPVGVSTLAVVARFDQFVGRRDAGLEGDPAAQTVTVVGGHCGMVQNPFVARVVLQRLKLS
ncbi:MAG: hypothetical protein AAGE98_10310 [Actinomycetota bacterium]